MKKIPSIMQTPSSTTGGIDPALVYDTSSISTLNGDSTDRGSQPDNLEVKETSKVDDKIIHVDEYAKAAEAPFHMQCEKLSRPFIYLKKRNAQDRDSKFKRMNGELEKNIPNTIWASDLAHEIQYIMICTIKREHPAIRVREELLVDSANYMTKIFEQILKLFDEDNKHYTKYDISALFELLIEQTYRMESTVTPTFYEEIRFNSTRKILEKFRDFVLELRKVENISDLKSN